MKTLSSLLSLAAMATMAVLVALSPPALAQGVADYPNRSLRIFVPTPAGGASDLVARRLAQALAGAWGQPVVVDNKPGAAGAIAAQAVMGAAPDGYTLLWGLSSMSGLPAVLKTPPYRHMNELAPVSNVMRLGYAVYVNKDVPVQSLAELASYSRANPGKLNVATGTLGEYMAAVQVFKPLGMQVQRVPYKGGAQLMPDLISGQVQLNVGPIQSGLAHVQSGKLKALAVLLPQRSALLPAVPVLSELGLQPTSALPTWNGLFAPGGTPRELLGKLATAVTQALQDPALRAALASQGADPLGGTPQQLADEVQAATQAWKSFVLEYDIAPE